MLDNISLVEKMNSKEIQAFIQDHMNDDPLLLVLKEKNYPDLPIKEIANQIKARQKAKIKLPELYANKEVIFPAAISMEQCSSEQAAKYKASVCQGKSITDLTGGFGIDLMYLSASFEQAIYVEQNKELAETVRHNYDVLGKQVIQTYNLTAQEYLKQEKVASSTYYLDPARRDEANEKVFKIEDCTPDLNQILPELLKRKAEIWIKLAPLLDIHQALEVLPNVAEVHVVSIKNECKELLFHIVPNHAKEPKIIAVNLLGNKTDRFEFQFSDEEELPVFSMPETYLYEPNVSIMKAGGFNAVANQYDVKKLQRNSHLYTSQVIVENFPGRIFKIKEVTVLNKKKLKGILPFGKANITVRNYPQSVKEIRKKTGINDGGEVYLFATTIMDGSLKVVVGERV